MSRSRSRIGLALGTVVLTIVGTLPPTAATAQPSPPAPDTTAPATPGSPGGPGGSKDDMHMAWLDDVLHGEGVVQTKDGPVRVAMQNGMVTQASGTSATVRSEDGWTRTWTLDRRVRVYSDHQTAAPDAIRAGTSVVVGGERGASTASPNGGGSYVAKIVLIKPASASPSAS